MYHTGTYLQINLFQTDGHATTGSNFTYNSIINVILTFKTLVAHRKNENVGKYI